MSIKPIETYYNGYRFRSRLEARWAVFFDVMGIKYEYEPEGYKLSDGTMYLPDFYLPDSKQYFEVKGVMSEKDEHKIKQFIKDASRCVTIGYPDFHFETCSYWGGHWEDGKDPNQPIFELDPGESQWLCKCRKCGKYWFMTSLANFECQCCGEYDGDHHFSVEMYWDKYQKGWHLWNAPDYVERALNTARQARFEHGETPEA